jgi:hypothetical protein
MILRLLQEVRRLAAEFQLSDTFGVPPGLGNGLRRLYVFLSRGPFATNPAVLRCITFHFSCCAKE